MEQPGERAARTLTALALPADSTVPCVGRFCAELGSRMPPTVLLSASSAFTNTRSPTGVTVLTCRWQAGLGGGPAACMARTLPCIAQPWMRTSAGSAVAARTTRAPRRRAGSTARAGAATAARIATEATMVVSLLMCDWREGGRPAILMVA